MIGLLVFVLLVAVVLWWRRRRRRAQLLTTPLAGLDTGVRSVWRVPSSRLFGPRRGF